MNIIKENGTWEERLAYHKLSILQIVTRGDKSDVHAFNKITAHSIAAANIFIEMDEEADKIAELLQEEDLS